MAKKDTKKDKKKTVNQMTYEELIAYMNETQTNGDLLNFQAAKDELENRKVKNERETFAKENPEKVEKFDAKKIPEYLTEGAKLTAQEVKEAPGRLANDLFTPMTEEEKADYEKQKEEYANNFGYALQPKEEEAVTPEEVEESVKVTPTETTESVKEERPSYNWKAGAENLGVYANALIDSIGASHKRKANNAVALSGFAGPYGSTQKIYSDEETVDPFQKIRNQTLNNYTSQLQAEQEAKNKAMQTDIKNKYKSIYDIDAENTAERQAYINEKLGTVQNDLNIDLNKKLINMKKEELTSYLKNLQSKLSLISQKINDKGFIEGLKQSLPTLIELSQEGKLTGNILGTNADVVGGATSGMIDAGTTITGLLAKFL